MCVETYFGATLAEPHYFPRPGVTMTTHVCQLQMSSPSSPLMAVDVGALIPLPALKTKCGSGMGMAVCPALGLLVTSNHDDNTLSVFTLPGTGAGASASAGTSAGMALVCTLGSASSPAPMQFRFYDGNGLGYPFIRGCAVYSLQ